MLQPEFVIWTREKDVLRRGNRKHKGIRMYVEGEC